MWPYGLILNQVFENRESDIVSKILQFLSFQLEVFFTAECYMVTGETE